MLFVREGGGGLRKKKMSKQKRQRFSSDQVRSMETIFQCESKLGPQKKERLASELGLEPRQVAIWFQNKRARWKSRELERELCLLQSRFNTLASHFRYLEREKHWLISQVGLLRDALKKKKMMKMKRARERKYHEEGDLFLADCLEEEEEKHWFEQGDVFNEYSMCVEDRRVCF